jgi:hypothetical protein
MSSRARERQEVIEAKRNPKKWQQERDDELEDKEQPEPEPEEPEPIHTFHQPPLSGFFIGERYGFGIQGNGVREAISRKAGAQVHGQPVR